MYKYLLSLFVFLYSLFCYAGTIDPNTSDSRYVHYAKNFHYIGLLCGEYNDGTLFCASAVLIDDFNILTAAHVVQNAKSCTLTVNNDNQYCIYNFIIHKDFHPNQYGVADIAVGHSNKSFNLKFYPSLYEKKDEESKLCCISGYGFNGTFLTGSITYDGVKRAGSNYVDKIDKDLLICSPSKRNDKTFTSLEFLISGGDSGGGLFIDNQLAGINSCIMAINNKPSSKYGEESGHTRISNFISWINENKVQKP